MSHDDDEHADREQSRRCEAGRALRVGGVLLLLGIPLAFSPLALGRTFPWNKYLVLCGLLLALIGASMLLNGGFDWLRSKR